MQCQLKNSKAFPKRQRRSRGVVYGHTLIELLAVMLINSVLAGIVITSILVLHKTNRKLESQFAVARNLYFLSQQLRSDLRLANGYQWNSEEQRLDIHGEEEVTIAYKVENHFWRRTNSEGTVSSFRLDPPLSVEIEPARGNPDTLIRLRFSTLASDTAEAGFVAEYLYHVGSNRRLFIED